MYFFLLLFPQGSAALAYSEYVNPHTQQDNETLGVGQNACQVANASVKEMNLLPFEKFLAVLENQVVVSSIAIRQARRDLPRSVLPRYCRFVFCVVIVSADIFVFAVAILKAFGK